MSRTAQRPVDQAELAITLAILDGSFPAGSTLPPERELATRLGITRPTLREALQRLRRDGWLDVGQGRPTRVRDPRTEGRLGVLQGMAAHHQHVGPAFVRDLLQVRALLAPAFMREAAARDPQVLREPLRQAQVATSGSWGTLARADWALLHTAAVASGNAIYPLILNGFQELFMAVARAYYDSDQGRALSRAWYARLEAALDAGDLDEVQRATAEVMQSVASSWEQLTGGEA